MFAESLGDSFPDFVRLSIAHQINIVEDLVKQGWSQQNIFLSENLTLALAAECQALADIGALKLANVGRGAAQVIRPEIRGDQIQWLKAGQSLACDRYLQIMETVRLALNQALYLGLDDYESHFAFYAPGASYLKHLDRFRDDDRRIVSVVIYLNYRWLPEQGGALRLHPIDKCTEDISPLGSRMVLFLSADMQHEVLPATRDRLSLAGWFRRRA
ncbi:2OG-Fe(II) oxygenase [Undibacterium sp. RTI2.1]|uniref:2OG-Fe(II) oxygenase n=1 Tax=unclassified Undibacterium TaxID=2630295 RepID=UPI002AB4D178|nr:MULTISPECIES: 2OG-Fe(II) oxygenase [unclassified Undibacterium]MDY7537769.1 2OG-Fe(II) oxygenase [Undibacterium sp. 5I1]MEB0030542.1 2OG-Fe(II) oxygenase [Undibacterium sp. RTI2.1]MEB0116957.1 2OG-Fe(II) oxygenase [Undibacterium sp. RTI2.2]MEB0229886.1 2OG-Fe(II) oxygenase [Undibacterium sp. 10I3]MEB0257649.1 2OG-Fe(II) oxygenase [Undibacterium sp. 5I1]